MKLFQFAVFATAVIVGLSKAANAHEGHGHAGHDHGSESQNPAASDSNTPTAPPSDSFVPESRPLESGPASRERVPNLNPNLDRQPSRDFRSFEPEPLNFGPESRPSRSVPPLNDRSPNARPGFDERQNRITPEFEARPRDFAPDTFCPLGRSLDECCPSARCVCPNQQRYAQPRPCPYGRDAAYECAWDGHHLHGHSNNEYVPELPRSFGRENLGGCPTGGCGHNQGNSEYRSFENYDNVTPNSIRRQPGPYFDNEPSNPSADRTFQAQPPRTFRN